MQENEILTQSLLEFYNVNDGDQEKMENAVESYANFFDFIENNPDIKDTIYGFFYKLFDDYISFKFYNNPIPALADNKTYMDKRKQQILETASTFFNFGGMQGVN